LGGTITGTGGDIIIVDDIIKNRKEANSPVFRENAWNEYNDTIKTRLEGSSAALILVMTRWHEDDLAGRLLKAMREDPNAEQWEVVKLEALKEDMDNDIDDRLEGEALWPWKFDESTLIKMKAAMPSSSWNSLYQQRPSSLDGNIFKREWMKNFYTKAMLPEHFETIIQSWDATFSESEDSDYVVGTVWGKSGNKFYLLDLVRRQMGYVDTKSAIRIMSAKWPKAWRKIIEKKANGAALVEELSKEIMGVLPYTPTESKVSRANAVSTFFAAGNVWLPDPSIAPWIGGYIEEMVTFPYAMNDDQVDSTSQALIDLGNGSGWIKGMTS
jgi:predicted phage terminase large subunit-like protein